MSGSVNKAILIGNLGADPEIKTFANGGKVANLRLATNESWTDRASGERRERVEWHSVVIASEGLVGVAERFFRKGMKLYIEGQLRTRKWQAQDGGDRWSTEIVLSGPGSVAVMIDGGGNSGRSDTSQYANEARERSGAARPAGAAGGTPSGGFNDGLDDDEIPF